ncbi:MAG: IscS subfamily cysteine desulfurase [Bacteroidota bacterium]
MNKPIYMDYHATTPVDAEVLDAMLPYFKEKFGNPASRQHQFGWSADAMVESSRVNIAKAIGADSREIVFTGGATESNNLALKGIAEAYRKKGNHIITVQTEHKSVLDSCKKLERQGFEVTYLPVDTNGIVSLDELQRAIKPSTILVSVMIANNEIGVIQPIGQIGAICRGYGIIFHTDATQAVGKIPVNVNTMNIDALSMTAHKIYGPKGTGALYVRSSPEKVRLNIQMDGGGHERGMRSGTLNVPGIVGLAKALEVSVRVMKDESARLQGFRDSMFKRFETELGKVYLNGHPTERLSQNLNVCFDGIEDAVLMMNIKEVAVSTGSACSTGAPEPSHVLKALKIPGDRLHSSIRFGLGRYTTAEEVEYVTNRVIESVKKLRESSAKYKNAPMSEQFH